MAINLFIAIAGMHPMPRLSRILFRACSRTVEAQGLDSGPVPWGDSRLSARQVFLPTDPVSLAARQKGLSRWITA